MKMFNREQTADILVKWYWLMRDVHNGIAYQKAVFDMTTWGAQHAPEELEYIYGIESAEPYCGTAACAAGFLVLADIIPGVSAFYSKRNANVIRVIIPGETYPAFPGELWEYMDISEDAWDEITLRMHNSDGSNTTALQAAERIQKVLLEDFDTDPATIEVARPWVGQTAFIVPEGK